MCLNNIFNVGHKSVYLISFKSKVVSVSGLYLTGSLLVGMHSCGPHVNDEGKVCGSIRSGRSQRGVNGCTLPGGKCIPDITGKSVVLNSVV